MPPTPALKCSPGRELKSENYHRRGHSFDSGLSFRAKDDDLVLFNEMQARERDNFLLHSNEDFDDSLLKLRCLSDYKLGIKVPVRGESSDLLNADGEKNDYDWLLTPPDTPLFPSLDDDEPPLTNLATRGRLQSRPISISKPSMAETNQRSSRGSASPHRRSASPRSSSSTLKSRGGPSSAPHSSLISSLRPSTPSRRPSSPLNKPSNPTPRSLTPTLGRMSSGSGGQTSLPGKRGTSPVKGTRGSSSSPKLRGWQSNMPGFSSDAPPNLRTSLSDRPISYSRGSSPASQNGKESYSRCNRQSMSPTASRSVSSSHSHDRERFSTHSKGSVASSGDDDVESLQSISVGISVSPPTARRNGVFMNNRTTAFSKKPTRTPLASSAPKRSFDSALRQMDHRKTPQNMFRPLMSSVPPSTFYSGKASTLNRPIFSRNSSLTTSSNTSSELGASIAHDTEGSDHDHADANSEWQKVPESGLQEEIFSFDKMEEIKALIKGEISNEKSLFNEGLNRSLLKTVEVEYENCTNDYVDTVILPMSLTPPCAISDQSVVNSYGRMATCSICGKDFQIIEGDSTSIDICRECSAKDDLFGAILIEPTQLSPQDRQEDGIAHTTEELCDKPPTKTGSLEYPKETGFDEVIQHVKNVEQSNSDQQEDSRSQLLAAKNVNIDKQLDFQPTIGSMLSIANCNFRQQSFSQSPSLKIDSLEGTGISVLLERSSSKGSVVQGRMLTASNMLCAGPYAIENLSFNKLNHSRNSSTASSSLDLGSTKQVGANIAFTDPSYSRENLNSIKLNRSRNSSTASSSLDLGSSRQAGTLVQRQLSSKGDLDDLRNDSNMETQSSLPSVSPDFCSSLEAPIQTSETLSELLDGGIGCDCKGEIPSITVGCGEYLEDADSDNVHSLSIGADGQDNNCSAMDTLVPESGYLQNVHLSYLPNGFQNCEGSILHEDSEFTQANDWVGTDVEVHDDTASNIGVEEKSDISETIAHTSSVAMLDMDNNFILEDLQEDCKDSQDHDKNMAPHRRSVSMTTEKNHSVCHFESDNNNHAEAPPGIHDESTVTIESSSGHKSRSLTLEEATDTILFCSSIIHDLAYKAASIGIEKEQPSCHEVSPPTVAILDKPASDQREHSVLTKRTLKSKKVKRKGLEPVDLNVSSTEHLSDLKYEESKIHDKSPPCKVESTKPPKLESKCNCIIM